MVKRSRILSYYKILSLMLQKSRILLSIVAVFRTLPLFVLSFLKAESNRTVLPEIVKIEEVYIRIWWHNYK